MGLVLWFHLQRWCLIEDHEISDRLLLGMTNRWRQATSLNRHSAQIEYPYSIYHQPWSCARGRSVLYQPWELSSSYNHTQDGSGYTLRFHAIEHRTRWLSSANRAFSESISQRSADSSCSGQQTGGTRKCAVLICRDEMTTRVSCQILKSLW